MEGIGMKMAWFFNKRAVQAEDSVYLPFILPPYIGGYNMRGRCYDGDLGGEEVTPEAEAFHDL